MVRAEGVRRPGAPARDDPSSSMPPDPPAAAGMAAGQHQAHLTQSAFTGAIPWWGGGDGAAMPRNVAEARAAAQELPLQ